MKPFPYQLAGIDFLAGGMAVGLAAINTGNNLLFLIFGFMLSLIVLSGILSEIVLRRVKVSRRLPRRAFAGTTFAARATAVERVDTTLTADSCTA